MKRITSCLCLLLFVLGLSAQQISIKGKIIKYSGTDSLTLEIYTQQVPIEKKIPVSKKGDFFYNYSAQSTHFVNLYLTKNDVVTLVASPGETISFAGEFRQLGATYSVTGSEQAKAMQQTSQKVLAKQKEAMRVQKAYEKTMDSLSIQMKRELVSAINANPSNYCNLILCRSLSIEEYSDVYQSLDSALMATYPNDAMVLEFHADVMRQLLLRVGTKINEISLPNQKLETINLSSLHGKVVLIDFWASWCRPCRMEIPNFKRMYNEFHDKGFDIYSISVDNDVNAWIKALSQEQMPWANVRDINKEYSNMFNVNAIPFTILIDAEGKIVAKGLRGQELSEKIAEVLKNTNNK